MSENYAILAFDFGTKYIGCAVCQSITQTAAPLQSVYVNKNGVDYNKIYNYIKEYKPKCLVVGLPLDSAGNKLLGKAYNRFLDTLRKTTTLKVHLLDETLTTKEAKDYIFATYGYKGLQKDKIDSISACLIAESWFNTNNFIEENNHVI